MRKTLTVALIIGLFPGWLAAAGKSQSALTLLEPSGARVASLGEATSSLTDDITATAYNPSLLNSLSSGQMSVLFQRGMADDGYGRLAVGRPSQKLAWGFSFGYYNSGSISVFDGAQQRSVVGERDMVAGLSLAKKYDNISVGVTGKYLTTELAETASAKTFTTDFGLSSPLTSNIGLGLALQNLGGDLKYSGATEELPRMARAGLSIGIKPFSLTGHLLTEGIYRMDLKRFEPALGLEMMTGPLAFRTGFRGGRDQEEFTLGTGFFFGSSSLDYAFGFADQLSSTHRISYSNRFGGAPAASSPIVKKPVEKTNPETAFQMPAPRPVYQITPALGQNPSAKVYFVRQGETLKSIARLVYGREEMWDDIYRANQHLMKNPDDLTPGMKILIPNKRMD